MSTKYYKMSEQIDEVKLIESIKHKKDMLTQMAVLISELNVKSDEVISLGVQRKPAQEK